MSIKIDRFVTKKMNKHTNISFEKKGWIGITDREKEGFVAFVKIYEDYDKNDDLAKQIIEIIEEEINEEH